MKTERERFEGRVRVPASEDEEEEEDEEETGTERKRKRAIVLKQKKFAATGVREHGVGQRGGVVEIRGEDAPRFRAREDVRRARRRVWVDLGGDEGDRGGAEGDRDGCGGEYGVVEGKC